MNASFIIILADHHDDHDHDDHNHAHCPGDSDDGCGANSKCTFLSNHFVCTCEKGYTGNGSICLGMCWLAYILMKVWPKIGCCIPWKVFGLTHEYNLPAPVSLLVYAYISIEYR